MSTAPPVFQLVAPARFVTIGLAAVLTGLTTKAIERKIERGDWAEGLQYRRGPDGRIYVDMEGYHKWVATEQA